MQNTEENRETALFRALSDVDDDLILYFYKSLSV